MKSNIFLKSSVFVCALLCAISTKSMVVGSGNFRDDYEKFAHELFAEKPVAYGYGHGPKYQGEDLTGQTIVLDATERGLGDIVVASRFGNVLKDEYHAQKVIVRTKNFLKPFFVQSQVADQVIGTNEDLPPHDSWLDAFKVPLKISPQGTPLKVHSAKNNAPYLSANPDLVKAWEQRLADDAEKLPIGICWYAHRGYPSGSDFQKTALSRSMAIAQMMTIAGENKNVVFYPLQPLEDQDHQSLVQEELRGSDLSLCMNDLFNEYPLFDKQAGSFMDTSAVIEVIRKRGGKLALIDSVGAQVAGGMGADVDMLLPNPPDWRWSLNVDGDDTRTPFYASMRKLMQEKSGDWSAPLAIVQASINEFARRHADNHQ